MQVIRKNTSLLGAVSFLSEFKLYGVVAILYFSHVTGSLTLGMSLFSASMLAAALFEIPTGLLSDRVGRKKTLAMGSLSALAGVIFYAIGGNYFILLAGAVLEGLACAFFSGNNDALLYDLLRDHGQEGYYAHYLGRIQSMTHLALSLSGVLGGIVLYFSSYTLIMWLSVIPKLLGFLVSLRVDEPARRDPESLGTPLNHMGEALAEVMKKKRLMMLIAADSLSSGAGEASYQFRSAFIRMVWPVWAIGLAGTLGDLGAALSYRISGWWLKKSGGARIILGGKLYSIASNTAAFLLSNVLSPILLTTNSLLFGVISVAQNEMAQGLYTDRHRASMASLKSLAGSLVYAVLALLIGLIADAFSVTAALLAFQVFGVISLLLYAKLLKSSRKAD